MEMEKEVKILNLDDILPNRFQPRIKFNESAILELADSIKEHGVIQPIVVRKISDKYEIIAGERRYKASVLAGKTTIPAIITNLDDKNSAEIALIENVQRQDLTPIEEAISYKKILDMGYLNQSDLAEKLGKTQSTIANKLRLLNLSEEVQEALLEQKISERHARSLLKLNENQQQIMLDRIITERLTVRKTDEEIKKMLESSPDETSSVQNEKEPELEILDLDLDGNEEQKMNEELNIPKEEIIEPVEEIVTGVNTWESPVTPVIPDTVSEPTSNVVDIPITPSFAPGFMDVEKIENEAQDIFKPQQEPADLDMLLKSEPKEEPKLESPMAPVTPEVTPSSESVTQEVPTGKFFNLFNFSDMGPSQTVDLEEKQVNIDFGEPKLKDTFMFNFNPLESVSPIQEQPQTIPESETIKDVDAFNPVVEEKFNNTVEPTIDLEKTVELPKIEENLMEFNTPSFTQPVQELNPVVSQYGENQTEATVLEESKSEIPAFTYDSEEISTPSISPAEIQPEEPEFEPFNPYALNDNNEFTQDNELNKYRIGAETSSNIIGDSPRNTYVVADMRTVINTIRECAKTIENYGFEVDLDELDFEDRYEVKFVINKK